MCGSLKKINDAHAFCLQGFDLSAQKVSRHLQINRRLHCIHGEKPVANPNLLFRSHGAAKAVVINVSDRPMVPAGNEHDHSDRTVSVSCKW